MPMQQLFSILFRLFEKVSRVPAREREEREQRA